MIKSKFSSCITFLLGVIIIIGSGVYIFIQNITVKFPALINGDNLRDALAIASLAGVSAGIVFLFKKLK